MHAYNSLKTSFIENLKAEGLTNGSIGSYEKVIRLFFNWLQAQGIEAENVGYADVLAYMKHCQKKGMTQRTVQNYVMTVRHLYDHMVEQEQVKMNPVTNIKVHGVKRKTLHHIFEPKELHTLYNNYQDKGLKGKRNKVMLGLLVYQGLKTEELARLEERDVKLKEGKIEIPGSRKSNARTLQLEPHQVLELYDYVNSTRKEILTGSGEKTDKLLVSIEGGSGVPNFMTQMMVKLRRQNKLVVNAKQLRASVVVKWLKQYNLRQVQYLAGHRYISSTEAYQQSEMEGLTEEVNKFHPLG